MMRTAPSKSSGSDPATRGSTAAVVLALLAVLGPIGMIALYVAFGPHVPATANPNLEVFLSVLGILFQAVLSPALAIIATVLALVNRRRGPGSRRNSGIALMILGIGVALFVLQVLLYLPR